MKTFFILMLLSVSGYSQPETSPDFTKQEVQQLIIKKLKDYSYKSKIDGVTKNYMISFNDSMMMILNLTESERYYSIFKIVDIDSVSIEEKDYNVSLLIKLKQHKQITTYIDSKPVEQASGLFEFLLDLSFLTEELPEKIGDAFRRLTNFYD